MAPEASHHNLREIYDRVNALYFEGSLDLPIKWFGNRVSSAKTQVKLGSYNFKTGEIKIHRLLDHPHIPDYFVSYIVYHEMLHHLFPPILASWRRRSIHHTEFKRREREFQEYAQVKEFKIVLKKSLFGLAPKRPRQRRGSFLRAILKEILMMGGYSKTR